MYFRYIVGLPPTQDSSHKGRFRLGFPTKNGRILVVTVTAWGVVPRYILGVQIPSQQVFGCLGIWSDHKKSSVKRKQLKLTDLCTYTQMQSNACIFWICFTGLFKGKDHPEKFHFSAGEIEIHSGKQTEQCEHEPILWYLEYPPWNFHSPRKSMVGRWNFLLGWSIFRC